MDDLLNTKQAAEYCGMSERCINIAVKENRLALATQSTPHKHYFDKSELQRFQATRPASKIECSKDRQSVKATAPPFLWSLYLNLASIPNLKNLSRR